MCLGRCLPAPSLPSFSVWRQARPSLIYITCENGPRDPGTRPPRNLVVAKVRSLRFPTAIGHSRIYLLKHSVATSVTDDRKNNVFAIKSDSSRRASLNKLVEEWPTYRSHSLMSRTIIGRAPYAVDQRWAWRCSIHSTAYSDAVDEKECHGLVPSGTQESSGGSSVWKFVRKESLPNCRGVIDPRGVLRDRIPFLTGSSRASNV